MGFMDTFSAEDRVSVKFSDFYNLVRNSTRAEMLMNGIKNRVEHEAIYKVVTGKPFDEPVNDEEVKHAEI